MGQDQQGSPFVVTQLDLDNRRAGWDPGTVDPSPGEHHPPIGNQFDELPSGGHSISHEHGEDPTLAGVELGINALPCLPLLGFSQVSVDRCRRCCDPLFENDFRHGAPPSSISTRSASLCRLAVHIAARTSLKGPRAS